MKFDEQALQFSLGHDTLLGVLAVPEQAASVAVLVVVGGPQYRVGSHRQFVMLARTLARAGHPVLRFDVRGMGDSDGEMRSFEAIDEDIGAAVDALLARCAAGTRVVLWGLCDGASAALLYLHRSQDDRVCGLCLVNPWVRSPASEARTRVKHYYARRLLQREFWAKLLRGAVAAAALRELAGHLMTSARADTQSSVDTLSYQKRMALAWSAFPGPSLLMLSGNDYTAKEFLDSAQREPLFHRLLQREDVQRRDLADADHTFSDPAHAAQVAAWTAAWLAGISG